MPRLSALHVYPLKSARGIDLGSCEVEPWGLAGDRRWMLVDSAGRFLSQRERPELATVTVAWGDDVPGALVVSAPSMEPLPVRPPAEGAPVPVRIWKDPVLAVPAGPEADAWFGRLLGAPVRLVHLADPRQRVVDPRYGRPEDRVSLADGYPLLLATTGSLDALCALIGETLPMARFRPNLVVDGTPAWAEDTWRRVRIGGVVLRAAKPSSRCVITTTDQRTGERRGPEPLRTLALHRRVGNKLLFGVNMIPEPGGAGVLRVGDDVEVLETAADA